VPRTVLLLVLTVGLGAGAAITETFVPGPATLFPSGSALDHPAFPGLDTVGWCEYNSNNSGYTITGLKAGFGVRLKPDYYPAVVSGIYHRVFRLSTEKATFRVVADDGLDGGPGTVLYEVDTVVRSYSTSFHFNALPAPTCTIWGGQFYIFMLGRDDVQSTLNWLHDGSRSAPDSTHWKFQNSAYSLFTPSGDMQMCAVVEFHDVALDSVSGFPGNDTVYAESAYTVSARCLELAGFAEDSVPVVLAFGDSLFDTTWVDLAGSDTVEAVFAGWQPALPPGTYDGCCWAMLASDARTGNDTTRFRLTVCPTSGIAGPDVSRAAELLPTVVRGVLFLPDYLFSGPGSRACLRDVAGRGVMDLKPGANDIRPVSPGVYFVHAAGLGSAGRRLVVAR
jgi:hypothetical protein